MNTPLMTRASQLAGLPTALLVTALALIVGCATDADTTGADSQGATSAPTGRCCVTFPLPEPIHHDGGATSHACSFALPGHSCDPTISYVTGTDAEHLDIVHNMCDEARAATAHFGDGGSVLYGCREFCDVAKREALHIEIDCPIDLL